MASFLLRPRTGARPLTLRITPADASRTIRLVGWLSAGEVPDLERAAEAGVRMLDLEGLLSADDEGLGALRRLRDRGVEIRNASRYLAILLG